MESSSLDIGAVNKARRELEKKQTQSKRRRLLKIREELKAMEKTTETQRSETEARWKKLQERLEATRSVLTASSQYLAQPQQLGDTSPRVCRLLEDTVQDARRRLQRLQYFAGIHLHEQRASDVNVTAATEALLQAEDDIQEVEEELRLLGVN